MVNKMDLSKLPNDRNLYVRDILTLEDVYQVIENVKECAPQLRGILVVGLDKDSTALSWYASLSPYELVYLAEVIKRNVFKPEEYSDIEDGQ